MSALAELEELDAALGALLQLGAQRLFFRMFPDEDLVGPDVDKPGASKVLFHAREKYPKHVEFFDAGREYRERCFMAGNRVGKTRAGGYETTAHLTGRYPDWWTGRRFHRPIRAWVAGKTNETTRDILQPELLGEVLGSGQSKRLSGTGLIPAQDLGQWTWKGGVADLVDTIKVRHVSGGWSSLGFKSYQQGRGSFEGTAQHVIWVDEEPPADVYGEAVIRTATTNGIVLMTFTPLEGLSEVVMGFMPAELKPEGA